MPFAAVSLRDNGGAKHRAFSLGLIAAGFTVVEDIAHPQPDDVIVMWNRNKQHEPIARRYERAGARVVVAENGYLGKQLGADSWYALALGHHNGAGTWRVGGPERWDSLGVELEEWRDDDTGEVVVLGQRGIGEPGVASPVGWEQEAIKVCGGRLRPHPGNGDFREKMLSDLKRARCVVTWGSGSALVAMRHGIPVFYGLPRWIGACAALPLTRWGEEPLRDDKLRLEMFRSLAWAMWRLREIKSGEAFQWLLTR